MSNYNALDGLIKQLVCCERIPDFEVCSLCSKARSVVVEEANVQRLDTPVTVCVDIHGQFYILKECIVLKKPPSD